VSKKLIIIASVAALLTFAGAFFGARMLGSKSTPPATAKTAENKTSEAKPATSTTKPQAESSKSAEAESQKTEENTDVTKGLTEKQLKSLVYDVREKINDYEIKEKELDARESRLQITQDTLKKDIETLNQLRVELATMVASLKEQKNQLLATRIAITENEKANLTAIAATYDKMDPVGSSKIISSMCAKQLESGKTEGGSIDDAVKILFYMNERSKGKLLAEIVSTEPKLAAVLCQHLKNVAE
jgi:hypothetical protein